MSILDGLMLAGWTLGGVTILALAALPRRSTEPESPIRVEPEPPTEEITTQIPVQRQPLRVAPYVPHAPDPEMTEPMRVWESDYRSSGSKRVEPTRLET